MVAENRRFGTCSGNNSGCAVARSSCIRRRRSGSERRLRRRASCSVRGTVPRLIWLKGVVPALGDQPLLLDADWATIPTPFSMMGPPTTARISSALSVRMGATVGRLEGCACIFRGWFWCCICNLRLDEERGDSSAGLTPAASRIGEFTNLPVDGLIRICGDLSREMKTPPALGTAPWLVACCGASRTHAAGGVRAKRCGLTRRRRC